MYCKKYSCKMSEQACRVRRRNNPQDLGCKDCELGEQVEKRYQDGRAKLKLIENGSGTGNKATAAAVDEIEVPIEFAAGLMAVEDKPSDKKWFYTKQEIQFLKDNIDNMTNKQLADAIGRDEKAVCNKLLNMGLRRTRKKKKKPTLTLDFTSCKKLYEELHRLAILEFRTPEAQVFYLIKQAVERAKYGAPYSDEILDLLN